MSAILVLYLDYLLINTNRIILYYDDSFYLILNFERSPTPRHPQIYLYATTMQRSYVEFRIKLPAGFLSSQCPHNFKLIINNTSQYMNKKNLLDFHAHDAIFICILIKSVKNINQLPILSLKLSAFEDS